MVVYVACAIVFQLLNTCKTRREGVTTPIIFQTTKENKVFICVDTDVEFTRHTQ